MYNNILLELEPTSKNKKKIIELLIYFKSRDLISRLEQEVTQNSLSGG